MVIPVFISSKDYQEIQRRQEKAYVLIDQGVDIKVLNNKRRSCKLNTSTVKLKRNGYRLMISRKEFYYV